VGNVIARHFADHQYSIALHYNSSEKEAIKSRDEIRAMGRECEAFQADVASESEVDGMITKVKERFERIDVLVTTSSIWSKTSFDNVTKEQLHLNFDVNTLGTFFAARAAGRIMIEQPEGGAIVTIGDWSIDRPYLDHVAYFVSKGALPTLTRLLARELGDRNPKVRVNCIHPGPVMFPNDSSDERKARLIEATVVKSADCPEMVAQAVAALVNNEFITGVCLPVDGGRHMYSPGEV
jgi:pteridine reductase